MSRADEFHDSVRKHGGIEQAIDHHFPGAKTATPWQGAGYLKTEMVRPGLDDRNEAVAKVLRSPVHLEDVDPRELKSTQPSVTREGVSHYLNNRQWEQSGATFRDTENVGNKFPTVYRRARNSEQLLLSGHHRATAALMRGTPLRARIVEGP